MANDIAFAENFTGILDAVYQRSSVSRCLNSGNRIIQASRHAKLCPASNYPQPRLIGKKGRWRASSSEGDGWG